MSWWKWFWNEVTGPDREFQSLDPWVIEREWIRGAEVTHRLNCRLLQQVVAAKGKAA